MDRFQPQRRGVRVAARLGFDEKVVAADLTVGDLVVIRDGRVVRMNRRLGRVFYV